MAVLLSGAPGCRPGRAVMGQVDQVQVVPARPLHGECRGGREADQGAEAGTHRLVDEFQAAAAGDHGETGARVKLVPQDGADEFVEGVVAADVFAAQRQFAAGVDEERGVQGAAAAREVLLGGDALAQVGQVLRRGSGCGCSTARVGRACSRASTPQRPQPVVPASWRRWSFRAQKARLAISTSAWRASSQPRGGCHRCHRSNRRYRR